MSQWFLSFDGKQEGPFDLFQAQERVKANPNGYAWREGYADWLPISQVDELKQAPSGVPAPPLTRRGSDEIDFKIMGSEMQLWIEDGTVRYRSPIYGGEPVEIGAAKDWASAPQVIDCSRKYTPAFGGLLE